MDLFNLEEEKIKSVKVNGHTFKIRAIFPMDKIRIAQRRAQLQGNSPVDSFTQNDFLCMENVAINDVCIEEMPKEFKQESCINWPDNDLIEKVAEEIKNHTLYIEGELKKNRPVEGSLQK